METYEEKHKDLVKRLNKAREEKGVYTFNSVLDAVAPELKIEESKDEKTKRILHTIANKMSQHLRDIFTEEEYQCFDAWSNAWLEKQGEHKKFRDSIQVGDKVTRNKDGVLVNLSQLNRVAKKDEKQGEQKPAAWSEDDSRMFQNAIFYVEFYRTEKADTAQAEATINWLKSLKERVQPQPKQEWSEEDESRMDNLCHFLEEYGNQYYGYLTLQGTISWLKFLRPQSHWKPSDEAYKRTLS